MLQITQVCERSIVFRKLLYDARILDVVQDLLGAKPHVLFHDQGVLRSPHAPAGRCSGIRTTRIGNAARRR